MSSPSSFFSPRNLILVVPSLSFSVFHCPTSPTGVMRFLPILALTGATLVQAGPLDQASAWFDNLKNQLSNAVTSPIDAVADAITGAVVQPLGMQNWKTHIWPKPDEEQEWLVYMTGGNKSCFGRCGHTNRIWNVSVHMRRPKHLEY